MFFVCDSMFGTLSRMLRMLGYDTLYIRDNERLKLKDPNLLEGRTLITKDKRSKFATHDIFLLDEPSPEKQLAILKEKFNLVPVNIFSICMECNWPLDNVEKQDVYGKVPARVFEAFNGFTQCGQCYRFYWPGTHYEAMTEKIKKAGFMFKLP